MKTRININKRCTLLTPASNHALHCLLNNDEDDDADDDVCDYDGGGDVFASLRFTASTVAGRRCPLRRATMGMEEGGVMDVALRLQRARYQQAPTHCTVY